MIKRLSLFCIAIIACVAGAFAQAAGTWNIMPVYGGAADCIVDTPELVYYLSKGHLYSYDKKNDETIHYSTVNKLNDVDVSLIAYNRYKKYLAVVYSSHNIDLLYDNGRVVNIPDIRDANISAAKTVNSVDFSQSGRMYVATGFGFVAFDDDKHRVADSGIYNTSFSYACELDGNIVITQGNDVYASKLENRHNSLESFKKIGTMSGTSPLFHRLGDKNLVGHSGTNSSMTYYVLTPDFNAGTLTSKKIDSGTLRMDFTTGSDEKVRFAHGTVMRTLETDGTCTVNVLPQFFYDKSITTREGITSMWVADTDGVAEYSISTNGSDYTQLSAPSKPETLTCYWPAYMFLSPDGNRIYISNCGYDPLRGYVSSTAESFKVKQTTNIIENNSINDISCYNIDDTGLLMTGGPLTLVEDINDPSIYYIANFQKGIYIIKDGQQIGHILKDTPFSSSWASWVLDVKMDRYGNLWVGTWYSSARNPIFILPAEKLKNPESIKKEDWLQPAVGSYTHTGGVVSLLHSRSNYAIYSTDHTQKQILFYDYNGTPTDLSDDKSYVFSSFVDQDGVEWPLSNVLHLYEDKAGRVWIAYNGGVAMIPDISTAIKGNTLYARRPKVSRNDGTNYADYLLDGETVFYMSSDPSGRKWFATSASGVFLTNEDGTEIIENFTTENSSLPSNKVLSVLADPHSNTVYFGTEKGVVSYSSTSAPAAEDFNDVYAYPNPVRPEYTGWITITGLMNNSLVKITDSAGNLVCQGTSEGGMFMWDGCNSANQRVRSGVYFVFASQNSSGSASGKPVTKIMVIN